MRTQVIPEDALGLPWLEHFPVKGGPPEKTIIDRSPFIIGRGESADLQVVSQGVSREHAALAYENHVTRIRDLGSTNGTYVNGQRIKKEIELHDGDMVQVANVELDFYAGKSQARQAAVTQILSLDAEEADGETNGGDPAGDLRRTVRRLHEKLVSGCVKGRLAAIVDLHSGQVAGHEACDDEPAPASPHNNPLLAAIPGRVSARLGHLRRVCGVEQAAALPGEFPIFVAVQVAEVTSGRFLELAGLLCELLADPHRLVIAVPSAAAREAAATLLPGGPLRELGASVALCDLGVSDTDRALLGEIRPEFVRIAVALVNDKGRGKGAPAIQSMIRAASEIGTKVIATGIRTATERAACQETGCAFGQGPFFEQKKRAEAPSRKVFVGGSLNARDAFYLSVASNLIEQS